MLSFKNFLAFSLITTSVLSLTAYAQNNNQDPTVISNKEKAVAVISSIETGDQSAIGYINSKHYIQHNLDIADGLAGFGSALKSLPKGSAKAQVKRTIQDGDYVMTQTEYNFFGPKVGFDIFRFKDGKIVEHWDNLQGLAGKNPSGRTQLDGATEIYDFDKTEQNKKLVSDFVQSILIKGDMSKINNFIGNKDSDYIQHNSAIADGLSGLGKALGDLAKDGNPVIYNENHKVIGEGNYVLSISEGTFMNQHVAFYDLFRVDNNKLVEHWDVIQEIPEQKEWKNTNGKFGF
ncbi:hypothetical protein DWG24_06785 [Dickeya zeae]|uniref:SnoaL-like domain-containing protein n=1 Tax=Dickeya zeae TaxID=204042 RepID=A0AAE6Z4K2_9GAMM|nr:hypothetical protein DWG24_06785 [Dickeya zeae]